MVSIKKVTYFLHLQKPEILEYIGKYFEWIWFRWICSTGEFSNMEIQSELHFKNGTKTFQHILLFCKNSFDFLQCRTAELLKLVYSKEYIQITIYKYSLCLEQLRRNLWIWLWFSTERIGSRTWKKRYFMWVRNWKWNAKRSDQRPEDSFGMLPVKKSIPVTPFPVRIRSASCRRRLYFI